MKIISRQMRQYILQCHTLQLWSFVCGKCNFSYDTVKLFFFSRFISSTASRLGEQVTEAFYTSIPSFSSLVWSLLHSLIWYVIPFYHILSTHLPVPFLTLCPPVILALILIQSFVKVEKEFQFHLLDVHIECLLHTSCWSIYPLAVPSIGCYRGIGLKRKIYKERWLFDSLFIKHVNCGPNYIYIFLIEFFSYGSSTEWFYSHATDK